MNVLVNHNPPSEERVNINFSEQYEEEGGIDSDDQNEDLFSEDENEGFDHDLSQKKNNRSNDTWENEPPVKRRKFQF